MENQLNLLPRHLPLPRLGRWQIVLFRHPVRLPQSQSPWSWRRRLLIGLVCCVSPVPLCAQVTQSAVDAYIYQGRSAEVFRSNFEKGTQLPLARLQQVCKLEPNQIEKLTWAMSGDLTRLFREIDRFAEETAGMDWQNDNEAQQQIWTKVQSLYERVHGGKMDNEKSLYRQMLERVLTEPQQQQFAAAEKERIQHRNQTMYRLCILELNRRVPITHEQREKLLGLMLAAPQPKGSRNERISQYIGYVMLGKVEDADLRQVFDEAQLKVVLQFRDMYAGQEGNFVW